MGSKYTKVITVTLIPILLLAALGRGNWGQQVLSLGALLWLGTPLLVAAGALAIMRQFAAAAWCIAPAVFIGLQLGLGLAFLSWDIYRSQRYCESLVPILDDIYAREGRYPATLIADPKLPQPPAWQFNTRLVHYYSDGATFSFEVNNPAEIFAGFTYRHDARQWEAWRD